MKRLFAKVLAQNRPELLNVRIINDFLVGINAALANNRIAAKAIVGGSVAKGTHLYSGDCDVFVVFSRIYEDKDISALLAKALKHFQKKRVHGSRDYFQIMLKGIVFEIIPVLEISNAAEAKNVTDVSPLHAKWVNDHIGKLHDEIRLAKLFCKAHGVYGAESHINGFSGYVLEILIITYGGFLTMLKAAAGFKPKQIIDIMHHYTSQKELFEKMNAAKMQSPLIVVDPVQPDRNAAAAVSEEKFARLVLAAKMFLKHPSSDFFSRKKFSLPKLRMHARTIGASLLLFSIIPKEGKEDVVGSKLASAFEYASRIIKGAGFNLLESGWQQDDKVYFWYIVYPVRLPRYERHAGPIVYAADHHLAAFLKKHKSFIVENNRLIAFRRRKYCTLADIISRIVKDSFIKEKVKKIKVVQ